MGTKSKPKKSEAQIKKELERLLAEIEVLKDQAQKRGSQFVSLPEQQLVRKLRGETSNSPFFFQWAWDGFTNAGSPSFYLANYTNPDPELHLCFVTIFFGLAHLDPDMSSAIRTRDARWPYVSTELVVLGPGEIGVADFKYPVPYAPKGTYLGNAVLWQWNPFESIGKVFDRVSFYVTLK